MDEDDAVLIFKHILDKQYIEIMTYCLGENFRNEYVHTSYLKFNNKLGLKLNKYSYLKESASLIKKVLTKLKEKEIER